MSTDGLGDILLATNLQARRQSNSILDSLCGTVTRRREERVCCVANLDDAGERRCPLRLRVTPEELEVDYGVGWGALYKALVDVCPWCRAALLIHTFQDFLGVDGVIPGLGLGTSGVVIQNLD